MKKRLIVLVLLLFCFQNTTYAGVWKSGREAIILLKKLIKSLPKAEQERRLKLFKKFRAAKGWEVCLQAHKGQYVTAGNLSSTLYANRGKCSIWETFKIINGKKVLRHGDKVRILTYQYRYWSAQRSGALFCNRTAARAWEVFTIKKASGSGRIKNGDKITLYSHHRRYVAAESGGGSFLVANRGRAGGWEAFKLTIQRQVK